MSGRGMSQINISWTTSSMWSMQDFLKAYWLATSNGGVQKKTADADPNRPPWGYEIKGINQIRLDIHNLKPTIGFLNRTGDTLTEDWCHELFGL